MNECASSDPCVCWGVFLSCYGGRFCIWTRGCCIYVHYSLLVCFFFFAIFWGGLVERRQNHFRSLVCIAEADGDVIAGFADMWSWTKALGKLKLALLPAKDGTCLLWSCVYYQLLWWYRGGQHTTWCTSHTSLLCLLPVFQLSGRVKGFSYSRRGRSSLCTANVH